ncbi:glycosyltransferase family 2 protein [Roseomonas eburnea]|uniref:Glycosyltransferase family 2 protein n=1 Tax=Neoroseomonas eburnea TaxID=1346889 RepID=A0A9X9X740_9PROT|nr:glycosyltransferase family 2 protein [Neoroseomonas eburnea]MBR0679526.1 glycosyltransferase family 2 protein [Neoroseomonas eburnea]
MWRWPVAGLRRIAAGARAALRRAPWLRAALGPALPALRGFGSALPRIGYGDWIAAHDAPSERDRARLRAEIATWDAPPLLSVVMPAYDTADALLRAAIASVQAQLYPHWELCIADDASPSPHVARTLAELAAADPRIRWVRRDVNGNISAASNTALALAKGEWVVLMDHDDLLPETALFRVAAEIRRHPEAAVIYSDEDKVDERGRRSDPYFKADFDPDLLLVQNMVGHLGAYRRELLERIGGFRLGFEGSQDHDLALRAVGAAGTKAVRHIPRVLYHWRQGAAASSSSECRVERCANAARRAITDALAAAGSPAQVVPNPLLRVCHRIMYPLPDPPPLVSVIVPTRDRGELLGACLDGLLHRTDYPRIEVIILDNESTEPQTLALLDRLREDPRVRILGVPGAFNYSRLNNLAVTEARGEVLLLLNNDIEVIEPGWLREMVSQAMRPEIGAVGAKLLYPDDTVQHAGVLLGTGWPGGVAGYCYPHARRDDPGPFGLLAVTRTVSAVTGACLAVRRALYEEVGGLDEEDLKVAYNDVDFCLRLRARGYRNLWTPFALLYHKESASRGDDQRGAKAARFRSETAVMRARWGEALDQDPCWNPNLSLLTGWPDLAEPPRVPRW